MTQEEIIKFRDRLEGEKEEIGKQIKDMDTPPQFDNEPGPDDETDESEEYFNRTSSLSVMKEKLSNIQSALIKIDKGTYGTCENCGKEISPILLDMVPESSFCQECNKQKMSA